MPLNNDIRTKFSPVRRIAPLLYALAAMVVVGCAAKRDHYDVPDIPLPDKFSKAPAVASVPGGTRGAQPGKEGVASAVPTMALDGVLAEWWRLLGNPELDDLVDRALANNTELRIAALKVSQAKARADQAHAEKWPTITAPMQAKGEGPRDGIATLRPGEDRKTKHLYQASLRGDWRVDLWGELASQADAADMDLWRAAFDHDDAQRKLVASVVSKYAEFLSLNDRLKVARETETVLAEMLDAMQVRMNHGDATITDVEQQKAAVYAVRATIPALELQREQAINALSILVGRVPGGLRLEEKGLDVLALPKVLPGVPSALVLQRPDVRAVEARMLAADANIDLAHARILPPLDLTAQVGYGSLYLSRLFEPHTLFWNAIANLSVTLFDKGNLSREEDYARAVHEEMVETYVRVIYNAVLEVEDALITIQMTARRLETQQQAARAARRAWELSRSAYAAGAIDYLALLDTERTYHRNLDESHSIRMSRYQGLVDLFSALGGGVAYRGPIPGEGQRPVPSPWERNGVVLATGATPPLEGGWTRPEPLYEGEDYWLVELSGLHDRDEINAAWRDLVATYGGYIDGRQLLLAPDNVSPELDDRRGEFYRLFVAKFGTVQAADEMCTLMQSHQQRCRVLASRLVGTMHDSVVWQPAERNGVIRPLAQRDVALPVVEAAELLRPASQPPLAEPSAVGTPHLGYAVQLGTFSRKGNAVEALAVWRNKGYEPYICMVASGRGIQWYTVRIGAYEELKAAAALAEEISQGEGMLVVAVPAELDEAGRPNALSLDEEVAATSTASLREAADEVGVGDGETAVEVRSGAASPAGAAASEAAERHAGYSIQIGTFGKLRNAERLVRAWREKSYPAYVCRVDHDGGSNWFAVRIGGYESEGAAVRGAREIASREGVDAIAVPALLDGTGMPSALDGVSGSPGVGG